MFQLGGFHLMSMQPKAAIAAGKSVPVMLKFGLAARLAQAKETKGRWWQRS